ncbi:MAG: MMPL family transporter [Acidimicrobiales bacterium]
MFTTLGTFIVRRSRLVLVAFVAAFLVAATLGVGVFGSLAGGGFDDPGSESSRAEAFLEEEFGAGSPTLVLIASATDGDIGGAAATADGIAIAEELATVEGVADVGSYWTLGQAPSLRSEDGTSALIVARALGDEETQDEISAEVIERFTGVNGSLDVAVGGQGAIFSSIGTTIEDDLKLAEAIAIPLTLLLLIFVFRGIVAALLPIAVGVSSIFGAFFVLWLIASVTDVSIFSINLVTALGLGLAIDYSLLVVSRFREELANGLDVDRAIVRTVETAGRTVAFSGLTVAVSLASLVVFPLYFLRSFAYAGVGVLLVAMLSSVIVLPALMHVLGHRVNTWSFGSASRSQDSKGWAAIAERVVRRPVVVAVTVVAVLILAGTPFLGVQFGNPDERVLPADDPARIATERIGDEFASDEAAAFSVIALAAVPGAELDDFAARVSTVESIQRVDGPGGSWVDGTLVAPPGPGADHFVADAGAWLNVVPEVAPMSSEAQDAVREIRDLDAPFETMVAGETAGLIDTKSAIFSLAPWAGLWIAFATFVLLFLMFGSFLVPLKAIVLNSLSLTATFGAMVWIFQEGNFAGVLDFTPTGMTDVAMPILMFAIAFGLSMDYEVFLLSRMKEEYDRTGDNRQAIIVGLAKTGRIVTAAALVLSITFFAFATGGITFMKLFGLGLGIAILVDAFIVRATLVPALMHLAGSANWWAPAWAKRIHARFGIDEGGSAPAEVDNDRDPVLAA